MISKSQVIFSSSKIYKIMDELECTDCNSQHVVEYMNPIEKDDGMHYFLLCEDCKNEWEVIKNN